MNRWLLVLCLALLPASAIAEVPLQFAAPGVRAPDDPHVNGLRFSVLHGKNQRVRGVDVGFFSLSETASLTGFSAIGGIAKVTGNMSGCSTALINIHSGVDTGLNAAFVNLVDNVANGANVGFVNVADGRTRVDLGGFNLADRSSVQLGFINVTRQLDNVQIGFLNFAENGFLPFFPVFNFPK